MKGTSRRGRTTADDRTRMEALRNSAKEQAENVMIVDMIRNDLGRIAVTGSVRVTDLFQIERYPNVWQMTSTVTSETSAALPEIFSAMHPSASVTGAPKVRTMELLRQWETVPRGVYTGAVGYIGPDGHARFNVAIRTAVVDHDRARVHFGVGSGIVWDSDADREYDECLAKGEVFGSRLPAFALLETMKWSPDEGFALLDRHLERLEQSADYFAYPFDQGVIRRALAEAVTERRAPLRVRLLLAATGEPRVETAALTVSGAPVRVAMAADPIDVEDVFLYHKTTHRAVYDRARLAGYDDTILWNGRGEVTESTIANVVVERDGRRVTPPVTCGLLAGTFRAELLAKGDVTEAVIPVAAFRGASRIWLVNSVQGWREATLAGHE
jgi:para-aminobenzoate synthetase/4-amino-4-deoxychorismate lyase